MSEAVQTLAKNRLLNRWACIVIFCSGLELQKVQTAVSEHFEILPKFMEVVIVPGFGSK